MDDKFYKQILIDHFKNPFNKKAVPEANFCCKDEIPSCGDEIGVEGKIKGGVVVDIGFSGSGCVISQAATSMLIKKCLGKGVLEILKLTSDDIVKMIGLKNIGPVRLKCAVLCLHVLQSALKDYLKTKENNK